MFCELLEDQLYIGDKGLVSIYYPEVLTSASTGNSCVCLPWDLMKNHLFVMYDKYDVEMAR